MKKKTVWIAIASVVGLAAIAAIVIFFARGNQADMASTENQEMGIKVQKAAEEVLTETILVTGKIVPEGEQKVFIEPDKGEIIEYKVAENQTVKAGEPLFLYDSSKLDVEYNGAVRERDLIQKRAKAEEAQIAELNKQMEAAKKNPSGEASGEGADVNQLTKEKVQLELQYESTKSEVSSAQERINEAANRKKDMTVVSKIDGIVVKVNQNIAKTETGASEPVVHIISNSPYKVIGTMSEFDAVKIQPGQAVVIRPKVYKDREWNGVVESVSQFPTEEGAGGEMMDASGGGNVTMYPFKVAITDDTSELRQGFHVSLEVKIVGTEKQPIVPHTAILDEGGVAVVYVLNEGKLARREVQTGSMNDEFIQITEGVNKNELVVVEPYEGMHDGMEVTSFDEIK
ncbi:efflux RND transporter periplasmic adaptor subunit [Niallia endozanthoxylica]|uniref:HlyD family efflux transporter periplasmic adaptor subunit n=1 Tax=Niallia endozanthoxylica TaxID=2036016 RepID=A0A5J5H047_9BACI|nr:HlyD family efflux transporter periplasmic adaptor subunit [Niallia endozanthoxylica]KAA9013238.1 HlyD family efflux transporter periplasmic adaptor subunit [Niallia endozanthoxylica]